MRREEITIPHLLKEAGFATSLSQNTATNVLYYETRRLVVSTEQILGRSDGCEPAHPRPMPAFGTRFDAANRLELAEFRQMIGQVSFGRFVFDWPTCPDNHACRSLLKANGNLVTECLLSATSRTRGENSRMSWWTARLNIFTLRHLQPRFLTCLGGRMEFSVGTVGCPEAVRCGQR